MEFGAIDDGTCDGDCENLHSLQASVLGFFIMFAIIIGAGALVGGLIALLRWSRKGRSDNLSSLMTDEPKDP